MRNHRPLREQPRVEPLEARILYSADPASAVFDAMGAGAPVVERRAIDAPPPQTPVVAVADGAAAEKRHELVLVDARVSNWQQLVDDMPRGADRNVEIVLLDAARDGIEQISERLAQERGLDAVHIVSHGEAGALQIGATRLDFDTLLADATAVSRWRLALNGGADLMLYGCDLAASGDGRALVDALSRLTGADVAASIDVTGGTAAGGDWVLEYAAGDIQASALAGAPGLESWAGSLQFALMGDETRANQSTSGTQGTHPTVRQVAIDAEGNFVVIWNDTVNSGDVLGCRFDASGNVLGSGQFTVNSTTPSSQGRATVAMNASGAFVVAWESAGQENGLGVYAQRFDANGLKQGDEIHVNQWTTNDQGKPSVAIDSAGNFIITWTSDGQDESGYGVYARRFDAAGNAVGDGNEFVVNSTTPNDQQRSSVALNDNGDFVIVWEGQDDGGLGILGQRFNGAGVAQGGEFHVNATPAGTQDYPSVAMTANGDFVVAWSSEGQDSSGWGAYAQRFNAAGVAQGDEIRVAETTSDDQDYPVVAMDSRGNFLVTWESYGQPGGSGWDVYGRLYDRSGNAMPEGELRINTTTSGTQDFPSVAWNGTQAVYVWAGNGTGDPAGIFFQRVNAAVAGATMSAISGNTTEATGSASFSITLNSQPTADVTISIASSDTTEGTVSTASLTFTAANWNVAQVVTVTGVNDAIDDGDVTYSIVTGDAVSSDANYDGLALADVSVTNADNDTAGVSVSAISGNTTEAGGTASFNVVLDTQPTADVTISITSSNTAEGIVSTSQLTFDSSNWNTAQTVTVTGVNDWIVDGNVPYMITTDPAQSDDSQYAGIDAADVSVANDDNDTAGIAVNPSSGLTTNEAGATTVFDLVLTSRPTSDVEVTITVGNTSEGLIDSASVVTRTFTAANWNIPQQLTVTGVDDSVVDGNVTYPLMFGVSSGDALYDGMTVAPLMVINVDNDAAGITVTPITGNTTEAGGTASFNVALNSQPTHVVTISINSSNTAEGAASTSQLTFDSTNWNIAQTVTVTGVNDWVVDGDVAYTITTGVAISGDDNYRNLDAADVSLINDDNDIAGITVTAAPGLTTTEAGSTASFNVVLDSQPPADVTVSIASSDTTEGTVSTASLTFTAANWNVAQVVTVTGVNDAIDDGDVTYSIVTGDAVSSDANYDGLALADVSVTNADNDTAGVSVSAISGNTTEAGGTAVFNVVLDTQPTADVTISITSSNTAEGIVSTSQLTFDSSNWNTAQTVTVTGVNDWIVDGNVPYMITTDPAQSDDSQYAGIDAADVSVTNMDNDTAGITVASSPGLTTTEAGGTASFGIVLGSEPTADVTISISTGNAAEGSVSVSSLTFTATNWNTAQFVTVTGVDDDVVDGDIAYAVVTGLATSDDTNYGGMAVNDVALANLDDERAPILTLPSVLQVDEDAPLRLGDAGVSVTDVNGDLARIDVAVAHGLLEVNLSGGASLVAASADHRSIGLTGTQAQLVDALARISYRSDADWSGTDALDVSATDASGLQASSLVAIHVSPVNDAPVITSAGHVRIAEGQLLATRVISTDVEGDTRHYAIVGGADAAQFVIDNASGELRLRSAPDAEAPADADRDNVYELTVEADDRQGGTTRQNLEVSVTGVNEAPSVLVTGLSVPTGGAVTLSQHQIIGRDVDSPAGSLVYSVSGVVNGRFELANQPGVAITSFSESALESGLVTLVHDAGTPPPQFVMIVSDGQASSAPLLVHAIVTSGEPAPGQHGGVDTAPLPEEAAGPAAAATEAAPAVAESAQPSRVEAPNPPRPSSQISAPADAARLADSTPRAAFTLQVPAATGRGEGLDIPWSREDPHKALLLALGYDADSRTSKELEGSDEPRLGPASDQDSNPAHLELGDVVLQTLGVALTAGSVWWALRATGLVTALLASLPAWRQFDFLPVLADEEDEDTPDWSPAEDAEAARDEAAVGRDLFVEGVLR